MHGKHILRAWIGELGNSDKNMGQHLDGGINTTGGFYMRCDGSFCYHEYFLSTLKEIVHLCLIIAKNIFFQPKKRLNNYVC